MPKSRFAAVVWLLGLSTTVIQALALAARYFNPGINADYIYPQLFAQDVLAGKYPLAGWTLSSAPYFFPDMAAAIGLCLLDGNGPVLAAYVAVYFVALAVLAGWSLQRVTGAGWNAWLGGVLLANGLLAWQAVGNHAYYLWLLGTLGFHGGVLLLGLACFALWAGEADTVPARSRQMVALLLLILGIGSDTLFLTQCVLPIGLGLWWQAGRDWRRPRVRAYAMGLVVALAVVAALRVVFAFAGWFNFSKVVRYAPLPAAIAGAAADFIRDVGGILAPDAWGLTLLMALSLGGAGWLCWRQRRAGAAVSPGLRQATWFAVAGLAVTALLPVATVYWRNAQHVRYLLPWLVLPGWLLLAWALPRFDLAGNGRRLVVFAAGLVVLGAAAIPQIRAPALQAWPYTGQQGQLDEFCRRHGLRYGLSDYWHAHEISTMSRAGVRLFPLRATARPSFWNNNAFQFYATTAGRDLVRPDYTFILVNGLDEAALLERFGEPTVRERVGEKVIWLYDARSAELLTQSVDAEVREFLRGRPGVDRLPAPRGS